MRHALLMQSLLGHMALLAQKHPKKAASAVARRARRVVERYVEAELAARPRR